MRTSKKAKAKYRAQLSIITAQKLLALSITVPSSSLQVKGPHKPQLLQPSPTGLEQVGAPPLDGCARVWG